MTKLWNIARFISSFPIITKDFELCALDKMILAQLNEVTRECIGGYEELDMYVPSNAIRDFAWNVFADHYVEAAKSRAYNQNGEFDEKLQRGAWYTLHTCLGAVLKLLAPICPFATEALWRELYSIESVHLQLLPQEKKELESELRGLLPQVMEFDRAIWKYKKERNIALSQEVQATIYASPGLTAFETDLKVMHKIKEFRFGKPPREIKAKDLGGSTFAVE
jgi:valyl-tRNA synthetase